MPQRTRAPAPSALALPSDLELRIERAFAAPRDKVYRAWTEPDLIARWMGGPDQPMVRAAFEATAGGTYRFVWAVGAGKEYMIEGRVFEADAPARLVTAERSPFGETFNLILFHETDGRTTATVHHTFPTKAARDEALACGAREGWDAGFARLDDVIAA